MLNLLPLAHSTAAERNRGPILDLLRQRLPGQGAALEIASGTGQHAAHFAAALPGWSWQPTDLEPDLFGAISGWAAQAGAVNVREPLRLDVLQPRWPAEGQAFEAAQFDLVFCANMLHIAPWPCCAGLMQGAARHLAPDGCLVTYGPYLEDSVPTAPGNLEFDASLRARNPAWGIRRLEDVASVAAQAGLTLAERHAMPANNLLLVWSRALPAATA
jgi:SAM-dependent methyltransferase